MLHCERSMRRLSGGPVHHSYALPYAATTHNELLTSPILYQIYDANRIDLQNIHRLGYEFIYSTSSLYKFLYSSLEGKSLSHTHYVELNKT